MKTIEQEQTEKTETNGHESAGSVSDSLRAPFPWFGGKSRVAHLVWERFGDVPNYVEPFAGSLAVLLGRPYPVRTETVNDLDCFIANFWRATQCAPEQVAEWADWPINEADLYSRHAWLVNHGFREKIRADPNFYDAQVAGWWAWGISQWIGAGWCSGKGIGVHAKNVNLKRGGLGVHRTAGVDERRPHLTRGQGVHSKLPHLKGDQGVHSQLPNLGGDSAGLQDYFERLRDRLRLVRVCCGDWSRVLGPSPTFLIGLTGIFLDPPYGADAERHAHIYSEDDLAIAKQVREWAIKHGENPLLRIALCGYAGEHDMPANWACVPWKTAGGYANQHKGKGRNGDAAAAEPENCTRERIWFSPHCLPPRQPELFGDNRHAGHCY